MPDVERLSEEGMTDQAGSDHRIRYATPADAPELARLFTQLDHPINAEVINVHWDKWTAEGNVALVVDQADGRLAAVVTLHQMTVLHRPKPVGRITLLVVDESLRGAGFGRALVEAAERFFTHAGCGWLEITSNFRLTDAHAFYEHLGYKKTSVRLAKAIDADDTLAATRLG